MASGANIVLHPKFTQTLDYEGEIGVIIGKAGIGIEEHNAMDHVWGYTIINGMLSCLNVCWKHADVLQMLLPEKYNETTNSSSLANRERLIARWYVHTQNA